MINRKINELLREIGQFKVKTRVARTAEEMKKYWAIRRESFNLLRKHVKDKRTAPFIDDFIVGVEKMPEFLPRLNEILKNGKMATKANGSRNKTSVKRRAV